MNEVVKVPSREVKSNPFNINILFLFALFFIFKNTLPLNNTNKTSKLDFKNPLDLLKSININEIRKKADMMIKTAPYLPENVVVGLNKVVPLYEKINAVIYLLEFLKSSNSISKVVPNKTMSQKEKIKEVVNIVNKEMPNDTLKSITPYVDVFLNLDKYKGLLNMFTSMTNSKEEGNQLDSLVNSISPLLNGSSKGNNKNIPIMDILKVLTSDDDVESKANNKDGDS